jgi:hypothetical protein
LFDPERSIMPPTVPPDPARDQALHDEYLERRRAGDLPPSTSPLGQLMKSAYDRHEARQAGQPLPEEPMFKADPPRPPLESFRPDGQPLGAVAPHPHSSAADVEALRQTHEPLVKSQSATAQQLEVLVAVERLRRDPAARAAFDRALAESEPPLQPMVKSTGALVGEAIETALRPLVEKLNAMTNRGRGGR